MSAPLNATLIPRNESAAFQEEVVCPPIGPGGRWLTFSHVLFYGSVALSAAVPVASSEAGTMQLAAHIATIGALVTWYSYWIARRGRAVTRSRVTAAWYFGVLAALWMILLAFHPAYELLFPTVFAQLLGHLPWRPAVVTTGLGAILVHVPDTLRTGRVDPVHAGFTMVGMGILILIIISLRAIGEQSNRRQRLVESLEATRQELAQVERRAGTLAERQRLAGDIHDTVAQAFTSVITLLEASRIAMKSNSSRAAGHVELALQAAREGLAETRRVVWALRPEPLEGGNLAEAIGRVTSRLERETGMAAHTVVTGQPRPLTADIEVTLLRAAQEALANIRRHARARQVVVTLSHMDDVVVLDVCDDGVGFNPAAVPVRAGHAGLGLVGMRERVEALRGSLTIESRPGRGTTLVVELPTRADAAADAPARLVTYS
jgi:signal transduction histidine kinase